MISVEQVSELAERIYDSAQFQYRRGDCCPCCGYDGLWNHSKEAAIKDIEGMLLLALLSESNKKP